MQTTTLFNQHHQQHQPYMFSSSSPRKRHRSKVQRASARSPSFDGGDSDAEADRSGASSSTEDASFRPRKRPHIVLDERAMGQFAGMRLDLDTPTSPPSHAFPPFGAPTAPPSSPTLARAVAKSLDYDNVQPRTVISTTDVLPDIDMRVRRPPSSFDIDAHRVCVVSLDDSGTESGSTDNEERLNGSNQSERLQAALATLSRDPSDPLRAPDLHINSELMVKLEEEARKRALSDSNALSGTHRPASSASKSRTGRGRGRGGRNSGTSSGTASPPQQPADASDEDRRRHALVLWSDPMKVIAPDLASGAGAGAGSEQSTVNEAASHHHQQPFQFGMSAPPVQTFGFGPAEGYAAEIMRSSTPMADLSSGSASPMHLD